ncbi:agmatine deiminase [Ferrimonas marina]|uniref:Putative agmatine deiminase n=1 Tax=Ferrimonas marina TaxID=299255 RepID=A0A1M5YSS3_9GAMM|nr:agmatine deiminase [Ferrimonas marina]SHI14633.1 agmatine deiminase [Ferrimonas marina]
MELASTPKQDGFYLPAETHQHQRILLAWPERPDNWRLGGKPAQQAFATLVEALLEVVAVTVVTSAEQFQPARRCLPKQAQVLEMSFDDAWMRDIGPTALRNSAGEVRLVSWHFNAWGGLEDGLYFPWDKDDQVAQKVAELTGLPYYQAPIVMEGGAFHCDGEGTLYTTEECLLHPSRNPQLSKAQIEACLQEYLGIERVIWLPQGLVNDETNGHVDNLLHVMGPAKVALTWCDDPNDPQSAISQQAMAVLSQARDARGRAIEVIKLPLPGPLYLTEAEAAGIEPSQGMKRQAGERLGASYANLLISNGCLFVPELDPATDDQAKAILQAAMPEYRLVGIPAREILLGGGNIHCITQPLLETRSG